MRHAAGRAVVREQRKRKHCDHSPLDLDKDKTLVHIYWGPCSGVLMCLPVAVYSLQTWTWSLRCRWSKSWRCQKLLLAPSPLVSAALLPNCTVRENGRKSEMLNPVQRNQVTSEDTEQNKKIKTKQATAGLWGDETTLVLLMSCHQIKPTRSFKVCLSQTQLVRAPGTFNYS